MSTITKQILSGAKWTALATIIITVIQIVQFAILGNLLTKEQFGIVGMITTVVIFTQILLDMGFSAAIIQKEKVSNEQLSTLYWLNIIVGIVLFVALFFASPIIAGFYNQPELIPLIKVLGIMFLIAPIGQQFQYLLQKDLNFNLLSRIEVATNLASFVSLLVLIFLIQELYAYVISQVILNSLKGILYFVVYSKTWKPSFIFNLSSIKELMSFGVFQLMSRLVNRIGANIDYILIGRFLGAEALGIYSLAYQVVTIPVMKINPIITRVAFPVFSRSQSDNKLLIEGFLNVTKMLALVSLPLLLGLMAISDLFIEVFFGARWLEAAPILGILAVVGILRVLMNPNGSIILAKGKANIAFYWDFGVMLLYGITMYFATKYDIYIVAWTYVVTSFINFFIGRWLLKLLIDLEMREYVRTLLKPILLTGLMAILVYFLKTALYNVEFVNIYINIALSVGLGGIIYTFAIYYGYPEVREWKPVKKIFSKTRGGL
ncbi:Teichuronic acid biosynthesis protein TuaB [Bacillus sp. LL01]|uniref:teichuronic acid biosynthesis protein TuaB n=1 Tax=Bacillus sp. LL01 TaxID=1665556 RepID=UPI00064CEFFF|nr:MOP flippase family protein [Bacillus sp. LL01]KMJ59018.1 Teichuronic acid biosynthesis protein TuaB [Bacillus sp. LL01]